MDIRDVIDDNSILEFIKGFYEEDKIIGAISIDPILLLKAGVNKEDLLQEGFQIKI